MNHRLRSLVFGLLGSIIAYNFGLLGFPGWQVGKLQSKPRRLDVMKVI